jgi:chromosome segregation ATPase
VENFEMVYFRDHARAKADRYENLASQLRSDLLKTESVILERQDKISELENVIAMQAMSLKSKNEAIKQSQSNAFELEDQLLKLTSDIQVLIHERELFSLHGQNAQDTVSNLSKMYEGEVHSHRQTLVKFNELQREKESCLDRILELEVKLNESQQCLQLHIGEFGDIADVKATLADRDAEVKDLKRHNEELRCLLAQLQSQRTEELLIEKQEQKKLVTALNHASSECSHYTSLVDELKTQISTLKTQKKVLVHELRSLRDRGVYEVPAQFVGKQGIGKVESVKSQERVEAVFVPEAVININIDSELEAVTQKLREIGDQKQSVLHLLDIDPDNHSLLSIFAELTKTEVAVNHQRTQLQLPPVDA